MIIIYCIIGLAIMLVLYLIKSAFENNVLYHKMQVQGDEESIRLFFISDSHAREISERMIAHVEGPIDYVIIGGDFADGRTSVERIEKNLKTLSQLGPMYFVWGNNDREVGEEVLRGLFAKYGVTELLNNATCLEKSKNSLWLSAIDDTSSRYNIPQALEKCPEQAPIIFVSHNPQIFNRVTPHRKPILMMGGHLHGGQIRIGKFGMQPHGSYGERNGIMTLISNGYGTTLVPFRLGAKPESHVIEIQFSNHEIIN